MEVLYLLFVVVAVALRVPHDVLGTRRIVWHSCILSVRTSNQPGTNGVRSASKAKNVDIMSDSKRVMTKLPTTQ